ncbi:hypothetical protein BV20DRAFT_964784 [Pilatotrama ljubarskyi]|nr:hypothetical protein BV20DRAFT_964784 [Pilatotrama ljubarskyi]
MSLQPPPMTAVMKGLRFEQRSLRLLREHLSMSLRRVGGKGDGGIDLQGWWWLPAECLGYRVSFGRPPAPFRGRLRVVAQCKAEEKKIGPRYIREFEGTILRHSGRLSPRDDSQSQTGSLSVRDALVGLFLSTSPFTKSSLLQAYSSPIPLALLHLPEPSVSEVQADATLPAQSSADTSTGVDIALPGTLLFNPALGGSTGILRGMVEPRWERSTTSSEGHPGIWMNGTRITSWTPEDHLGGGDPAQTP